MHYNKDQIYELIKRFLSKTCKDDNIVVEKNAVVHRDFNLDSINFVYFLLWIEMKFEIRLSESFMDKMKDATVSDYIEEIARLV